jgi:hypothetical protein
VIDANLVSDGLDGLTLSGDAYWVREHLVWTDGSNPEEVENHLVLASEVDPCEPGSEGTTTPTYETTGDPIQDCERYKAAYAQAAATHPAVPDALWIEFDLWASGDVEPHIAVQPVEGTFHPTVSGDGALWYAFYGSRTIFDWNAGVAAALDCTAEDPWANTPDQTLASTLYSSSEGALVLSAPDGDNLAFELDAVAVDVDRGAPGPGGTLDGEGVFRACDTTREITPSPTYD